MRRGTNHEMMPEDVAAAGYVLGLDFEDSMPQDMGADRAAWHRDALKAIQDATGVHVLDLVPAGYEDPRYSTVCDRLNAAGFDTYDSDTTLEVYRGPVTCSPDCATDCQRAGHPDDANPYGMPRPTNVTRRCPDCGEDRDPDAFGEWASRCDWCRVDISRDPNTDRTAGPAAHDPASIRDARAYVAARLENCTEWESDGDDDEPHTDRAALEVLDTALDTLAGLPVDVARARRALADMGDPADWDDLGVVEYYVQEIREALEGPAPVEPAGPGRYVAEVLIGTVYRVELDADSLEEARELAEDIDPDDEPEGVTVEDVDTSRIVLDVTREG